MCWIGSLLFFVAANLLLFSSDRIMQNVAMFTNGHWGSVNFFYFMLILVYWAMLATGIYVQYGIYLQKRETLRFSYLSVQTDDYKAVE